MRATAATSNLFKDRQFEMDQTLNDPYDGDPDLQRDADFTSTQYDPSPERRVTVNYDPSSPDKTRNNENRGTNETGAFPEGSRNRTTAETSLQETATSGNAGHVLSAKLQMVLGNAAGPNTTFESMGESNPNDLSGILEYNKELQWSLIMLKKENE